MSTKLTINEAQQLIDEAVESFPWDACETCECFLGYVVQLQMDGVKEIRGLVATYKPDRKLLHKCLGCDPCPSADLYAAFSRRKADSKLI